MPAQLSPTFSDPLVSPSSSWARLWSPVQAMVNRFIPLGAPCAQRRTSCAVSPVSIPAYLRSVGSVHRPYGLAPAYVSEQAAPTDGRCAFGGLHPFRHEPVRVIRMSEQGIRRGQAGRMVISGRMADVCAELDRLAEREAAIH